VKIRVDEGGVGDYMREVVLDTETTGLGPKTGDRIVEIGCIELVNHIATGETYHQYVNPEREMPAGAFAIHGLSEEDLSSEPVFADIASGFLDFVGDATLIIHNAKFDIGFINAELERLSREPLPLDRTIDTVRMARAKFPGAPASLDALCRRFQIDNSNRDLHGALKDARLLAEVYLELIGGRQCGLELVAEPIDPGSLEQSAKVMREARPHTPTTDEQAAHAEFLEKIKNPIWLQS